MPSSFAATEALSRYFEDEANEQRSHYVTMKAWLPGFRQIEPSDAPPTEKSCADQIVLPKRKIADGDIIVEASKDWNKSHAVIFGAFAGAAYALVMCGLANLFSFSMTSAVILAVAVGAAIGAATLGGIASPLNYVKAVNRGRDESPAAECLPFHPCVSNQGAKS